MKNFITLADKLISISEKPLASKKTEIKIFTQLNENENTLIYSDKVEADELQIGNFNTFRKNVNMLTSYFNGLNIKDSVCTIEIGGYTFEFKGGKFLPKVNDLFNLLVARNGGLARKKDVALELKNLIIDKFLPQTATLTTYLNLASLVESEGIENIKGAASLIRLDLKGEKLYKIETETKKVTA